MINNEYYMQVFHEIKNSVTLINSYFQLIQKRHPEIMEYDYWAPSRAEISRLRTIVTELSQIKFGSDLHPEILDLRDFVTECCNGFPYFTDETDISYTCILTMPQQPLMASIDPKQLRHALINLLKNACEAMTDPGKILVNAFSEAERIFICITDSGIGIAPSLVTHIFEPFVTTKEDGSGLGLNITQQIIQAHKGTITVGSKEGEGSTFTIILPRQDSNMKI